MFTVDVMISHNDSCIVLSLEILNIITHAMLCQRGY